MSRGYWRSVQDEVEEAFAAAETRGMCLCVKSDRTKRLLDRRADVFCQQPLSRNRIGF